MDCLVTGVYIVLSEEITLPFLYLSPFQWQSTLKGNNCSFRNKFFTFPLKTWWKSMAGYLVILCATAQLLYAARKICQSFFAWRPTSWLSWAFIWSTKTFLRLFSLSCLAEASSWRRFRIFPIYSSLEAGFMRSTESIRVFSSSRAMIYSMPIPSLKNNAKLAVSL